MTSLHMGVLDQLQPLSGRWHQARRLVCHETVQLISLPPVHTGALADTFALSIATAGWEGGALQMMQHSGI
jgi:hypothetical protein